jgi:hypothetical protein
MTPLGRRKPLESFLGGALASGSSSLTGWGAVVLVVLGLGTVVDRVDAV